MIARLIVHVRYLRAWWAWFCDPTGDFRLDDDRIAETTRALKSYDARMAARRPAPRDCTSFDCVVCLEIHVDHTKLGRQAIEGAAILDITRWLAANGWTGREGASEDHPEDCAGRLQRYACWLRKARAAYEKAQVAAS